MPGSTSSRPISRRSVIEASAGLSAAALAYSALGTNFAHAAGSDKIRIGLVGCGGRGRGAVANALDADPGTELYAIADLFQDHMDEAIPVFTGGERKARNNFNDRVFVGWDAYKKLLATDVQYVILATPPTFRPMMVQAAIEAGKSVFAEKPVAVCPTGVRMVIAAAAEAEKKGLGFGAGTQRRHQRSYQETMKRVLEDGAIGKVVAGYGYWIQAGLRAYPREKGWSDMESQLRNWWYFTWLSGDTLVEQALHQCDVMNWAMGGPPKSALGMGGRQSRTDPLYGHVYDHFVIEYQYPSGAIANVYSRQCDGAYSRPPMEYIVGTKGTAYPSNRIRPYDGEDWRYESEAEDNPLVQEHADVLKGLRAGKPLNVGKRVAESTLTAIMGRMSAYTGQLVTWDFALNKSKLDLTPKTFEFGPREVDPVAMPGKDKLI